MCKAIRRVGLVLWPPLEAYIARKYIDGILSEDLVQRQSAAEQEVTQSMPESGELDSPESLAKLVFESETKRKETIENKALAFLFAVGISISVISVIPGLFGEKWGIPLYAALTSGSLYALAIVHLLVAAYYAVDTRRVTGLALPCYTDFLSNVKKGNYSKKELVVTYMVYAKLNEPVLTKKSNSLAVAEALFLRGLALLALAGVISGLAKVLVEAEVILNTANLTTVWS